MTKISFKYMTAAQIKQHLPDQKLPEDQRYPVHKTHPHNTNQDVLEVFVVLNSEGDVANMTLSRDVYDALPTDEVDYVCCQ